MMYTIEELESLVSGRSNAVDITDIVDQLLATLKRIEAAAAIEANVPATGAIVDYAYSNGWDQCREQFRKALGL